MVLLILLLVGSATTQAFSLNRTEQAAFDDDDIVLSPPLSPTLTYGASLIDADAMHSEIINETENVEFVDRFISTYCKKNTELDFCVTYNKCKTKSACDTASVLDDNTNLITNLLNQFGNVENTNKLFDLTDKLASHSTFIFVSIIVLLKVIIITLSSVLAKRFSWCKKIKRLVTKNKKSDQEDEATELETIMPVGIVKPLSGAAAAPTTETKTATSSTTIA